MKFIIWQELHKKIIIKLNEDKKTINKELALLLDNLGRALFRLESLTDPSNQKLQIEIIQILLGKLLQSPLIDKFIKIKHKEIHDELLIFLDHADRMKASYVLDLDFQAILQAIQNNMMEEAHTIISKYCSNKETLGKLTSRLVIRCIYFEVAQSLRAIDFLHSYNADFNQVISHSGDTLLIEAVNSEVDFTIIDALINAGANVNLSANGRIGITPLHTAACNLNLDLVEFLLNRDASPLITYNLCYFLAQKPEAVTILEKLLTRGLPFPSTDDFLNPLKAAIECKNEAAVLLFFNLKYPIYPNAIVDAIYSNEISLLELIIDNSSLKLPKEMPGSNNNFLFGKRVSYKMFLYCFNHGLSLKNYSLKDEHVLRTPQAVSILLEMKPDWNKPFAAMSIQRTAGYSPLATGNSPGQCECLYLSHVVAALATKETFPLLMMSGLDIHARDSNGLTPLHYAAANANVDVVKLLILAGADINAVDNLGRSPLDWTRINGGATSTCNGVCNSVLKHAGAKLYLFEASPKTSPFAEESIKRLVQKSPLTLAQSAMLALIREGVVTRNLHYRNILPENIALEFEELADKILTPPEPKFWR